MRVILLLLNTLFQIERFCSFENIEKNKEQLQMSITPKPLENYRHLGEMNMRAKSDEGIRRRNKGTLRPKNSSVITGDYLSELLDWLTANVNTNHATKLSDLHDVNLICNGVYLGDKYTAKDRSFLVKNGFTHILNAAEGFDFLTQVDTSQEYYRDAKINYLGIPGEDRPSWNISVYFEVAAKYIDNAVKNGGKVLVHCVVGISRSATLVLAYLMICKKMNAAEALEYVFKHRRIFPNIGFLHHLAQLNSVIRKNALLY